MSKVKAVSASEAKKLSNENHIFVDVREPAEFNTVHIENSKLHPVGNIHADHMSDYAGKTVVVYCQKGMRGQKACEKILKDNPSADIVNLSGGIEGWQQAGFSVKKGESNVLPLDRQVQITIGSFVLCFALLGYFVNPNFGLGAAFMGAGLLFAGISGFCGLARVMALMPWNK
jgi:rhodanese-related sulfurtransferase